MDALNKIIAEKNYTDKVSTLSSELSNELKQERLRDFEQSKPVIKHYLEMEILKKYNRPEKDVVSAGLHDDLQVQVALGVLKNREVYNSLLNQR